MAWFPGRNVEFAGGSSPSSTKYSPSSEKKYRNENYSLSKFIRFYKPSSVIKVEEKVPHMYKTLPKGLETFKPDSYNY